jgi:hypothetical protein
MPDESAAARELQVQCCLELGICKLAVGLLFGGRGSRVRGVPCTLYFSYAAIRLAREANASA